MRIVIDLQGAQSLRSRSNGIATYSASFAEGIIRNRGGHEVIVVLNAAYPETVMPLRKRFGELLPQQNILTFDVPGQTQQSSCGNDLHRINGEHLREAFLASLRPDVVHITSLFEGFDDQAIASIGKYAHQIPTSVTLHDLTPLTSKDLYLSDPLTKRWYFDRLDNLRRADHVLSISQAVLDDAIRFLGFKRHDLTNVEPSTEQLIKNGARQHKKSSWTKACCLSVAAFEALAAKPRSRISASVTSRARPRLAFVSPLPPQESGIATYSAELLPELSRHYEIDCIVPEGSEVDESLRSEIGAYIGFKEVAEFLGASRDYDRVLYHIGNSEFHAHMFTMLEQVPGVVVQHDFFLSGVLSYLENHYGVRNLWSEALYHSHGYKALAERFAPGRFMETIWKYPSSRQVFDQAFGTIVHSNSTLALARKWLPESLAARFALIPSLRMVPARIDRDAARASLDLAPDEYVVCTFGMMGETKLSRRLLEAWLSSKLAKLANSRLVFVGQAAPGDYGKDILERIASSEAGSRVTITGWATEDMYGHYLQACDVAVQLRTQSRGETSRTILDCMAQGKPTIVNAHGSAADMPEDGVFMLPDEFSEAELTSALETLFDDPAAASALGSRGQQIIRESHSPRECASRYARAIEDFYGASIHTAVGLARCLGATDARSLSAEDRIGLVKAIGATLPPPDEDILYIDVSAYAARTPDAVGELVRRTIIEDSRRVEPITWSDAHDGFVSARRIALESLQLPQDILADQEPVSFVRNCACMVISRDHASESLGMLRWERLRAQFNIEYEFTQLAIDEPSGASGFL